MQVTAIVPLKALPAAKGRLAPRLDPGRRRELVTWMFGRVLGACRASAEVTDVLVVAGDPAAAALARNVACIVQPRPGLAAALGAADAVTAGADATLVVVADLPLVIGGDLDAVCRAGRAGRRAVVVAPTADGGTGALYRRPAAVVQTAFGPGSAAAHVALARAAGIEPVRLDRPALALDVDTPGQLGTVAALGGRGLPPPERTAYSAASEFHAATPARSDGMPQGTVKHFDVETGTGTILLDDADEVAIDSEAFAASGLLELRLGQRVRFSLEPGSDRPRVRDLNVVSL